MNRILLLAATCCAAPLTAAAAQTSTPLPRAHVWATLEERDLVVEGTAWDPVTRSVLFGSLNKSKIVALSAEGAVTDRVPRASNGLGSLAGLHVDSARGTLWVASNPRYDRQDDTTSSALFAFDVATGAFKARYLAPAPGPHFLNDITTDASGGVFVTDSRTGNVWTLPSGGAALRAFAPVGKLRGPNGITISDDARLLFVASADGISVADLRTGQVRMLASADSAAVRGIDGLAYHRGALIAHHPLRSARVVRYRLDATRHAITASDTLEAGTPDVRTSTTGEVVGPHYVFIGNSQIDRMNAGALDSATMQPIRIYRVSLEPRANGLVLVSLSGRDSVAAFDALTLARVATLRVGNDPHEIATSPDGATAYVANAGDSSITVIAGAARASVTATWRLPNTIRVHDVAASADGRTVWAASGEQRLVLEIDAITGATRRRIPITRPGGWMIEASSADAPLVIGNLEGGAVTLLSARSGAQTVLEAREGEIDAAATPDGSEIWSVNLRDGHVSIYGRDGTLRERVPSGKGTGRVLFTPDGRTALVVNGGDSTITAFDVRTRRLRATINVPSGPKVIAMSRDGRRAYVSHPERGALTMIDVPSLTILRTVDVPGTPDGVAVLGAR